MYLKRVTITGFKSFANKTVIDLERGITGVVGPNGSGKSNLADAIRWALGEQRGSRLRLEGRDEVVFAGSAGRARASYAEVVMLFDNESGAFPLDITEVEISRRLYRSGETDYRLAGRSVRLADITALLAQAGVGAGSYAVIGQGMIDSILMSSPAERKLLFEEAAGVRAPELGREAALRKLTATAANLTRLRDIAAELGPRLGTLQAAVGAADERRELEDRVNELRRAVTAAQLADAHEQIETATAHLAELQAAGHRLRHEQRTLEQALFRHERAEAAAADRRQTLQGRLSGLESSRDEAAAGVAAAQAALASADRDASARTAAADRLAEARTELAAAAARLVDLQAELKDNAEAGALAAKAVDKASREVAKSQAELVAIREGIADGARDQYVDHALQIIKLLALGIGTPEFPESQVKLLIHKAGRLLSHATKSGAADILVQLKSAQKRLESVMSARDTAVEHQANIAISRRSLEIDIAHQEAEIARLTAREAEVAAELAPLDAAAARRPRLEKALEEAHARLAAAAGRLEQGRAELAALLAVSGGGAEASQVAVALERARAQAGQLAQDHAATGATLAAAREQSASAQAQAAAWGLKPADLSSAPAAAPLAVLADQLARAEASLEAKAQAYQDQLGEYQQVSERHTELVAQIADLEAAETDLTQLVSQLDALIRTRFKENFQALAEQFSIYFDRLFEGGSASLELSESDTGDYGVVIKASPKGKRLTGIAALSGGERALAGVALVAAIMKVNPSPFVVLDEIDAALDEANSGRLAGILTELQQYSQLIVITHNRQTMQAAQVLFGVTLGENHVSKLISMRLEQATQLAAR